MFIVKFQGGLGNQMFQYSLYRALERRFPEEDVMADLISYRTYDFHNGWELGKVFGIEVKEATDRDIVRLSNRRLPWKWKIAEKIRNKIKGHICSNAQTPASVIYENSGLLWELIDPHNDYYFDGYWAHSFAQGTLLEDVNAEAELRSVFSFRHHNKQNDYDDSMTIRYISEHESVSVHIRRGDYVGSNLDILDNNYYRQAMNLFSENACFVFFSDDIEFVEREYKSIKNKIIVHGNRADNSFYDMYMMSLCKHHIIANSTFSFWGAWLGDMESIVVCPEFKNIYRDRFYACKGWKTIKNM